MLNDDNSKKKKKKPQYIYIYTVATCRWHENPLILDEKMDGCTISIFFHNTGTTYKKKKLIGQKIKVLNCRGQKVI